MEKYQISGHVSSGVHHSIKEQPLPALTVGAAKQFSQWCRENSRSRNLYVPFDPSTLPKRDYYAPFSSSYRPSGKLRENFPVPLVTTLKSQRKEEQIEIFPRNARVYIPREQQIRKGGGVRGKINSFTFRSKKALRDAAEDAFPYLVSTFCLTYHEILPDGLTLRKHRNVFLSAFRRKYNGASYLWVVEFQDRGYPHFHFYHSLPYDLQGLREWIGDTWHRITGEKSEYHLWFHKNRKDKYGNFNSRPWTMTDGGYLCKYLSKQSQKMVPEGYLNIGRFWGCSRCIIPLPERVKREDIQNAYNHTFENLRTGEVLEINAWHYILRTFRKHQKSSWRGKRKFKYPMTTIRKGRALYVQIEAYLEKQVGQVLPF